MHRLTLLSAIVAVLLASAALAQTTHVVVGRITTADGAPLADVSVSLEGTSLSARPAADGQYRIDGVPAPFAGVVMFLLGTPPVSEGEPLASVGHVAEEKP